MRTGRGRRPDAAVRRVPHLAAWPLSCHFLGGPGQPIFFFISSRCVESLQVISRALVMLPHSLPISMCERHSMLAVNYMHIKKLALILKLLVPFF